MLNLTLPSAIPFTLALRATLSGISATFGTLGVFEHFQVVDVPHIAEQAVLAFDFLLVLVEQAADQGADHGILVVLGLDVVDDFGNRFDGEEVLVVGPGRGAVLQLQLLERAVQVLQRRDLVGERLAHLLPEFEQAVLAAVGDALVVADFLVGEHVEDGQPALRLGLVDAVELGLGHDLPFIHVPADTLVLGARADPGLEVDQAADDLDEVLLLDDLVREPEWRASQVVRDLAEDVDAHDLHAELGFVESVFPLVLALADAFDGVDFGVADFARVVDQLDELAVDVVDEFAEPVAEVLDGRAVLAEHLQEVEHDALVGDEGVRAQTRRRVDHGAEHLGGQLALHELGAEQVLQQHHGLRLAADRVHHELVVPAFRRRVCLHVQFLYQRMLLQPWIRNDIFGHEKLDSLCHLVYFEG